MWQISVSSHLEGKLSRDSETGNQAHGFYYIRLCSLSLGLDFFFFCSKMSLTPTLLVFGGLGVALRDGDKHR